MKQRVMERLARQLGLVRLLSGVVTGLAGPSGTVLGPRYSQVRADVRVVMASCTNGSNRITAPANTFTAADVGKVLILYQITSAGTYPLKYRSTITTYIDDQHVDCSSNATATITNGWCAYGTDQYATLQAELDAMADTGASLVLPVGIIASLGMPVVPNGVELVGQGYDWPAVQEIPQRGTTLLYMGYSASGNFVTLGSGGFSAYGTGHKAARLRNLNVDAVTGVPNSVAGGSRHSQVNDCTIWRGSTYSLQTGAEMVAHNLRTGQYNYGSNILVQGDSQISHFQCRQAGNGRQAVHIKDASGAMLRDGHVWKGGGGDDYGAFLGPNVLVEQTGFDGTNHSNIVIDGIIFDGTAGPHIRVKVGYSAPTIFTGLEVTDCSYYQNQLPDAAAPGYPVIELDIAAGSELRQPNFLGLSGIAVLSPSADTDTYTAIAASIGAGKITGATMRDCKCNGAEAIYTGWVPAYQGGNQAINEAGNTIGDGCLFADLPDVAESIGAEIFCTDVGVHGTVLKSNGIKWRPAGGKILLLEHTASGSGTTVAAGGSETLFGSVAPIPAELIEVGDNIRLDYYGDTAASAGSQQRIVRLRSSDAAGEIISDAKTVMSGINSSSGAGYAMIDKVAAVLSNTTALASGTTNGGASIGTTAAVLGTLSDITAANYLGVTVNPSADASITAYSARVWLEK